jgi:predicted O-linked N-acetylglucosamine transferase (SPINDLY family)
MQILQRVPQAVLWLIADNSAAALRLQQMAERQGVSSSRLVFARRRAAADYLAQYRQADLFLDCLPYNAGTTASDALWMGVPVLTQAGNTYAGRMAASLLTAAGLAELITDSDQAYVDLAVGLAADRSRLTDIRQHLISSRDALPLFDTPQTVHHLEAGYRLMVQRYEGGLPSADITVRSN